MRAASHATQEDLNQLQPIPTTKTKSGYVGVYPARRGKWQAQVYHKAIGSYGSAWEAGVAVVTHLVVMAMAEEQGGPSGQPAAKAPVPEALDDAQCSRCTKLAGCVRNANHPGLCRQEVGARARAMAVLRGKGM